MSTDKVFELRGENLAFYQFRGREAIISGPAETGKTLTALLKLHTLLSKPAYSGMQATILRKVYRDIPGTVLRTYCRDILGVESPTRSDIVKFYGGEKPEFATYPNGSRVWFGGLDNPGKTLSGERDVIFVPQAEQLSATDWQYLMRATTGRGAVMPYTQLLGDCNPGNKTHWILHRDQLRLFTSVHKNNPTLWDGTQWTEQGQRTIADLQSFTGALYKRLYQGLWSAPEGMIYDIFDSDKHAITAFDIPAHWPRVVGIDPFGDNVAAVWLTYDPQNKTWIVYREHAEQFGVTMQEHTQKILDKTRGETIFYWCGGGPSERQPRTDMSAYGIPLLPPATGAVWTQIGTVKKMLKAGELFIHSTCAGLISEIGEYHRVTKNGEVQEGTIHNKGAYHLLDALRYAVTGPDMSRSGMVLGRARV